MEANSKIEPCKESLNNLQRFLDGDCDKLHHLPPALYSLKRTSNESLDVLAVFVDDNYDDGVDDGGGGAFPPDEDVIVNDNEIIQEPSQVSNGHGPGLSLNDALERLQGGDLVSYLTNRTNVDGYALFCNLRPESGVIVCDTCLLPSKNKYKKTGSVSRCSFINSHSYSFCPNRENNSILKSKKDTIIRLFKKFGSFNVIGS